MRSDRWSATAPATIPWHLDCLCFKHKLAGFKSLGQASIDAHSRVISQNNTDRQNQATLVPSQDTSLVHLPRL
ncbi:hypothetical protein HZ326_8487 [Fusarium oxysporum f. sp. albedinis]|nr:hypothetical protein HZ326_8487 [Fusarium oxysporum f. sp. albedinis]